MGCAQADDDDGNLDLGASQAGSTATAGAMAGMGSAGMMGIPLAGAAGSTPIATGGTGALAGSGGMVSAAGSGPDVSGAGGMGPLAGSDSPTAGTGGTGGMGEPMMHEDLGMGDGSDVITIGDSWMNLILTGIEQSLESVSGRDYRNYAVPGTLVLNEQIPGQYASAKAENPNIKTVVMTGGGNDILTSSCTDDACEPIVDDVSDRLFTLMQEMGQDGVEDVVLIGYTYPADMGKHASLDYSRMLAAMQCTQDMTPRCHQLDSTMLDITLSDGIHPDGPSYDLIGMTVWQMMQDRGMRR